MCWRTNVILCFVLSVSTQVIAHDTTMQPLLSDVSKLGSVSFKVSCDQKSQTRMNQGVALLHHMMYRQAEVHFSEALKNNQHCSMFRWGVSMTQFNPLWPTRPSSKQLSTGAHQLSLALTADKLSSRERYYVNAANEFFINSDKLTHVRRLASWRDAQKELAEKFTQDIDAQAFHALAMLATAPTSDPEFSAQQRATSLLKKLYLNSPTHPGVIHYSIHAYDNPKLADKGLDVARAYDKIAPDVPHALHMPTHIFVRTGAWHDVVSWNIRSAKAALDYPARDGVSMHYPHAIDYLVYAYMQLGKDEQARSVLDQLESYSKIQAVFPAGFGIASARARYVLEGRRWQEAAKLPTRSPTNYPWQRFPDVEAITHFARGTGAARSGQVTLAQQSLTALTELHRKTLKLKRTYWGVIVDGQRLSVAAWLAHSKGEYKRALELMSEAASCEDSVDKNPVTPGAVLPARELLGDMKILVGDYAGAIDAYSKALQISPNRLNSLRGMRNAYKALNKPSKVAYYQRLIDQLLIDAI